MVTGGAGFIGSAVVRRLVGGSGEFVLTVDSLTYAGNLDSLEPVLANPRHRFERADVCDDRRIRALFQEFRPDAVVHLAAESHVDRSIDGPAAFVQTNVVGTFTLLQESLRFWRTLPSDVAGRFRFVHVSTDEVFGDLDATGFFTEETPYSPSSPYSASKAASDHLVHAWHRTYGLPVVTTNCSNNYGPYQFPEKLIPLMILNGLAGKPLPVYGKGENVRDWLFVDDHAEALLAVLAHGTVGETYLIGGRCERTNLEVVTTICRLLDELNPSGGPHARLISYVADRPGHDHRYAIDSSKIARTLGWRATEGFEAGLRRTIRWYMENRNWWERIQSGAYRGERLGLGPVVAG